MAVPLSIGNWHVAVNNYQNVASQYLTNSSEVSNNYAYASDGDSPYVCSSLYRFVLSIDFYW